MSDEANLMDARQVMHFFAAWCSLRVAEGAQVGRRTLIALSQRTQSEESTP